MFPLSLSLRLFSISSESLAVSFPTSLDLWETPILKFLWKTHQARVLYYCCCCWNCDDFSWPLHVWAFQNNVLGFGSQDSLLFVFLCIYFEVCLWASHIPRQVSGVPAFKSTEFLALFLLDDPSLSAARNHCLQSHGIIS